jgi:hypothetical protein
MLNLTGRSCRGLVQMAKRACFVHFGRRGAKLCTTTHVLCVRRCRIQAVSSAGPRSVHGGV